MKKQRIQAKVKDLVLNEGQLGWLPKNPRQWTQEDIDKTKRSLERDPDFQEDNPLKLVAMPDGKLLVFAGNLRTTAAIELKWKTFESILYTPETEEDKETIKRRTILDNGSFGSWDVDIAANEWDGTPWGEWGGPKEWESMDNAGGINIEGLFNPEASAPAKEKPIEVVVTIPATMADQEQDIRSAIQLAVEMFAGVTVKE